MTGGSAFGSWATEHGLPVFVERLHPDDAACTWDPIVAPSTNRHWCALGNRRLQIVGDNFATTAIRDTAERFRWLTPSGPGTGATIIKVGDGTPWGTDLPRWPASWAGGDAPVRTWGPTWTTVAGTHDGIEVERTVACPEGDRPWVLVRVVLTASEPRVVEIAEEWRLVHDDGPPVGVVSRDPARVDDEPGDEGLHTVWLTREVELRPASTSPGGSSSA